MRSILTLLLFTLFPGVIFSQESDQTIIWKVSGGDLAGASYVVGTLPVKDSVFFQYPEKMFNYLSKTDVFISFDNEDLTDKSKQLRKQTFSQFNVDYGIYPAKYLETLATQELKPVISLPKELSLQYLYKNKSTISSGTDLKELFYTGDIEQLIQQRLSLDLTEEILQQLQQQTNYSITNKVIEKMRLQPTFFPLDIAYLSGQNGLINLLKARGYKVQPLFEKEFSRRRKRIAKEKQLAQQAIQNQQAVQTVSQPSAESGNSVSTNGGNVSVEASPRKILRLDVPMGILNLKQWRTYTLNDSLITYLAPLKLKKKNDLQEEYKAINNHLEYVIKFSKPFANSKQAINKLIIDNGGQLTFVEKLNFKGYPATRVEMIYNETILSKHLLIHYPNQAISLSVKGKTPQIFSEEAGQFFEQIELKAPALPDPLANNPAIQPVEEVQATPWNMKKVEKMNVFLPEKMIDVSKTLKNGKQLKSYVIPRGEIDDNVYLFTSTPKEQMDLFKLFNESINTATAQSRAVIVERNVLPPEQPNYSYYLLKDAIDNYYKVHYWYYEGKFYQFIIKGNKQSVYNSNARQIRTSISFGEAIIQPEQPMSNVN